MSDNSSCLATSSVTEVSSTERQTLWVRDLPENSTEEEVRDRFSSFGQVSEVLLAREGGNRGGLFACVTYAEPDDLVKALQTTVEISGKTVTVYKCPPAAEIIPEASLSTFDFNALPSTNVGSNLVHQSPNFYYPPPYMPGQTVYYPQQLSYDTGENEAGLFQLDTPLTPTTPNSVSDGTCHVCSKRPSGSSSTPTPTPSSVTSPVPTPSYLPPGPNYYYPYLGGQHQLQPLTPILTPAPSPTLFYSSSLPAFFPHNPYSMPPTPSVPSALGYPSYSQPPPPYLPPFYPPYQGQVLNRESTQHFPDPPPSLSSKPGSIPTSGPSTSASNRVKRLATASGDSEKELLNQSQESTDLRNTKEMSKDMRPNVSFFTSPYKRFSTYTGTPTKAKFPLQLSSGNGMKPTRNESSQVLSGTCSWYKEGSRWGHRDSKLESQGLGNGQKENIVEPDIVKDLENCKIQEA